LKEKEFNPKVKDHPGVHYMSFGGGIPGKITWLRLFYGRILQEEGRNDGLVE
jgi:hypothetical protein